MHKRRIWWITPSEEGEQTCRPKPLEGSRVMRTPLTLPPLDSTHCTRSAAGAAGCCWAPAEDAADAAAGAAWKPAATRARAMMQAAAGDHGASSRRQRRRRRRWAVGDCDHRAPLPCKNSRATLVGETLRTVKRPWPICDSSQAAGTLSGHGSGRHHLHMYV